MIEKTVKYVDYNGKERIETLNFHLKESELMEMEANMPDGIAQTLRKLVDTQDYKGLIAFFKEFLLQSYGVKSPDGRQFIKNEKLREEFSQTEVYSDLFMELATNDKAAADFINGVIPSKMQERFKDMPEVQEKLKTISEETDETNNASPTMSE